MGKMKQFPLVFFVVCVFTGGFIDVAVATQADQFFIKGSELYQAGDYEAAVVQYQQILDLGYESWEVFYNLGNCYHKQGALARAILNYERAKRLAPEDEDIEFNIELANLEVVDRIQELPRFLLGDWLNKVTFLLGTKPLGFLTLTSYLFLMAVVILRILFRPRLSGKAMTSAFVVSTVCFVFLAAVFCVRVYHDETHTVAIVLSDKVDVKSAPDQAGTDVFTLHQGVKVEVKDRSLEWVKIRLADGKVGWMRQEKIEVI